MIRRHLENVLNDITHRITNAVTEGQNARIQWIKYSSRVSAIVSDLSLRSTSPAAD
jgi:transposase